MQPVLCVGLGYISPPTDSSNALIVPRGFYKPKVNITIDANIRQQITRTSDVTKKFQLQLQVLDIMSPVNVLVNKDTQNHSTTITQHAPTKHVSQ